MILCNKEENTKEIVERMSKIAPVHVSDIITIEDNLQIINQYGILFDREKEAGTLIDSITTERKRFKRNSTTSSHRKVGYFIWKNPYMVAGDNTFINTLLEECGFVNAFKNLEGRYPEIALEEINDVDLVLLSSEPYPFKERHIQEIKEHTGTNVMLVDGEFFSWYGSRLEAAYPYFQKLLKTI